MGISASEAPKVAHRRGDGLRYLYRQGDQLRDRADLQGEDDAGADHHAGADHLARGRDAVEHLRGPVVGLIVLLERVDVGALVLIPDLAGDLLAVLRDLLQRVAEVHPRLAHLEQLLLVALGEVVAEDLQQRSEFARQLDTHVITVFRER
jgi:hypothetical protein